LLGTAARQWRAIGGPPFSTSYWMPRHRDCEASTRRALDDPAFDAHFRRGAAVTLTHAIRYASSRHDTG
jgi:hypothetical protein